jgi:cobalt-zinc-cadmium efflux system protein
MVGTDHGHDDHTGHKHGSPGHVHAPANFGTAFAVGIALNLVFVMIEAGYGIVSNSMALLADAGHNLSDVLGLAIAWIATILAKRLPDKKYTYGLRGSSILAALFNAVFLLVAVGAIAWEAVQRLGYPEPVAGKTVMVVAAIGIVINGLTAWLFASGAKGDLNIRGAFLHMAADAAVSAGVVIAGLIILLTGWLWLDPLVSLAIVAVIMWGTWGLLRDSVSMSLNAVPRGIDAEQVRGYLQRVAGVASIHDLHIWPMSTTETALTCHVVMPEGCPGDAFLAGIAKDLHDKFGIEHATVQVERGQNECALEPDHVV